LVFVVLLGVDDTGKEGAHDVDLVLQHPFYRLDACVFLYTFLTFCSQKSAKSTLLLLGVFYNSLLIMTLFLLQMTAIR
jgi:hypothetical protein